MSHYEVHCDIVVYIYIYVLYVHWHKDHKCQSCRLCHSVYYETVCILTVQQGQFHEKPQLSFFQLGVHDFSGNMRQVSRLFILWNWSENLTRIRYPGQAP